MGRTMTFVLSPSSASSCHHDQYRCVPGAPASGQAVRSAAAASALQLPVAPWAATEDLGCTIEGTMARYGSVGSGRCPPKAAVS